MSEGLYDEDGIDGPFERRMRAAMRDDAKAQPGSGAGPIEVEAAEFERMRGIVETEQRVAEAIGEERLIAEMFKCFDRLRRLGWRDAAYAPKDGRALEVIEAGSTGIHKATRDEISFWVHDDMDSWPSDPILYREAGRP